VADRLPPVDWTARPGLAALAAALGPDNLRWVGGAVRDTLLGHKVQDIDAATIHRPEQVMEMLAAAGIRAIPTGIDHGTVTAILPDGKVEVTTLRHDVSTDGRRATVAYAADWREDAARRDFTINALYARPETLEIADYFGGLADLSARRVRFIGDARQRIREDHLRILRYFRFSARFGGATDSEAESACAELAATLKGLSRERVAGELLQLLALPDPADTVERMARLGVLAVILPECTARELAVLRALPGWESEAGKTPDPVRRLAAMIPALPSVAEAVAARLRLSKSQRARLVCAAGRREEDKERAQALAYEEGIDCAHDRLLLLGADTRALHGWNVPEFPLKGGEIVSRGVAAGPDVARTLQAIERQWVEQDFPPREAVLQMLEAYLAQRA